ncbi:MAG: thioredoxin family protein [Acidobacteriota bacterium]|nr:thioredoxin family protein [Acidobacteriota bacterium]
METLTLGHTVVSSGAWLEARKALLAREKELTRMRDALNRERMELPWEKVEKKYVFDGPNGKQTLADLFVGKSQLFVYHFMMGPGWVEGCPSCSLVGDGIDGCLPHLAERDVTLLVVSRATLPEIEVFKKRMGWKFKWVSSNGNDFNRDYHVSFTAEQRENGTVFYNYTSAPFPKDEAPGLSVFYKDESGEIFHTYSTYGRGLDPLIHPYTYLDLAPKGRDEDELGYSMQWVRHHDRYVGAAKETSCCAGGELA